MNIQCSICLELITENCEGQSTPCGFLFHKNCLGRSIQAKNSCPQCRKSCTGSHQVYLNTDGAVSAQSEDKFSKLLKKLAKKGALENYKMALQYEDNKNPTNAIGETPLHWAASKGRLALVKYIIKNVEEKSPKM